MATPRTIPGRCALAVLLLFAGSLIVRAEGPTEIPTDLPPAPAPIADIAPKDACPAALETAPDRSMTVSWQNGFIAKSADDDFRIHIGGRLDFDNSWYAQDDNLLLGPSAGDTFHDGALFRRARIRADGLLYGWIDFVAEVNFANIQDASNINDQPVQVGSVGLANFYLTFTQLPLLGNIRVGHFKAPVGLERYTSSNAWYYMERSSLYDAFLGPENYQDGVLIFNSFLDDRLTLAGAVTRVGPNNIEPFGFGSTDTGSAYAARLTALPIYEDEGRTLMHLGVGAQVGSLPDHQFEIASRPLVRSGTGGGTDTPNVVDTGAFFSPKDAGVVDFEWATVYGPFSMSAEYAIAHCNEVFDTFNGATYSGPRGNVTYSAFYVESGLFVTPGDYRRYDKETGTWARTVPEHDAVMSKSTGWHGTGAVQLLVRFTYLDLVDGDPVLTSTSPTAGAQAGRQSDVTFGVNWYLNSQTWIMANVILSHIDSVVPGASGDFEAVGVRFHIDF